MLCNHCGHHRDLHKHGTELGFCGIDFCHCRSFVPPGDAEAHDEPRPQLSELRSAELDLSEVRSRIYTLKQQLTAAAKEEALLVSRVQSLRDKRATSL